MLLKIWWRGKLSARLDDIAPASLCRALFLACGLIAYCSFEASAQAQNTPDGSTDGAGRTDSLQDQDNNGQDFTRPQRSFEFRPQFRTSSGSSSQTDRWIELLRYNSRLELGGGWRLGYLVQLPLEEKTVDSFNPPNVSNETGLGGAAAQAALIRTIDRYWAFGFGARVVAPGDDMIGSGKWQVMPGFGVRYSFVDLGPDTYFVPVIRYAVSVAGDPTRRNISEPQIAPTLNIGLPDRWFMTFYPSNDIRINFGDPVSGQTGKLFLPFDAAIGRSVTDHLVVSFEASAPIIDAYPVYKFKAELRVVVKF